MNANQHESLNKNDRVDAPNLNPELSKYWQLILLLMLLLGPVVVNEVNGSQDNYHDSIPTLMDESLLEGSEEVKRGTIAAMPIEGFQTWVTYVVYRNQDDTYSIVFERQTPITDPETGEMEIATQGSYMGFDEAEAGGTYLFYETDVLERLKILGVENERDIRVTIPE